MAFVITSPKRPVASIAQDGYNAQKRVFVRVVGDGATYAAGGFALTAATYGLAVISYVIVISASAEGSGGQAFTASWDDTNGKVKLYKTIAAGAAVEAAGADFSASIIVNLELVGY